MRRRLRRHTAWTGGGLNGASCGGGGLDLGRDGGRHLVPRGATEVPRTGPHRVLAAGDWATGVPGAALIATGERAEVENPSRGGSHAFDGFPRISRPAASM